MWHPPGAESVSVRLHIGKRGNGFNFNGLVFRTWQDWRRFLTDNTDDLRTRWFTGQGSLHIEDEYGLTINTAEFVEERDKMTPDERAHHFRMISEPGGLRYPLTLDPEVDYLDPEGYSFYRGEFS